MTDPRIIEQFNARSPFKWEDATVVVLSHVGSHSHGTYIPKDDPQAIDDIDYMGVIIPPIDYALGLKHWEGLNFQFEELDCVFYSFQKFMNLLMKNNPNVIGMLWMKDEFLFEKHPVIWDLLIKNRNYFSSLLAYHSFIGYAHSQLSKMESFDIKTQNEWDFALKVVELVGWTKEAIISKNPRPMPDLDALIEANLAYNWEQANVMADGAAARIHNIHAKHFQGYMGEKRKNLVRKYGYDTKNAAHLIRLMRMCCEFLETGELNVFRTHDAEEIKGIKQGAWTVERVKAEANALFERAKSAKETSTLPVTPFTDIVNDLTVRIHLIAFGYI